MTKFQGIISNPYRHFISFFLGYQSDSLSKRPKHHSLEYTPDRFRKINVPENSQRGKTGFRYNRVCQDEAGPGFH